MEEEKAYGEHDSCLLEIEGLACRREGGDSRQSGGVARVGFGLRDPQLDSWLCSLLSLLSLLISLSLSFFIGAMRRIILSSLCYCEDLVRGCL